MDFEELGASSILYWAWRDLPEAKVFMSPLQASAEKDRTIVQAFIAGLLNLCLVTEQDSGSIGAWQCQGDIGWELAIPIFGHLRLFAVKYGNPPLPLNFNVRANE
jgi:hypothetical protein